MKKYIKTSKHHKRHTIKQTLLYCICSNLNTNWKFYWKFYVILIVIFEGVLHPEMKMYSSSGHPRWVCFFIRTDFEIFSITSLALSEQIWRNLQWMGAVRMRVQTADKSIVIWWTGVMWIILMFLSVFELSFWWHPFTANFSKSVLMKKESHLHLGWLEEEYIHISE